MLLYRTHKKLKKHTFKIKSKRVNRKSNKVRRQQRGGWPGDEKKQIKRQFLVNAILLQSMYNNTRNQQIKNHLDYVMGYRDFFMEKTGEIPQNITLQSLDNEKETYDTFHNSLKLDIK